MPQCRHFSEDSGAIARQRALVRVLRVDRDRDGGSDVGAGQVQRSGLSADLRNRRASESTIKLIVGHSRQGHITYGLYSPGVKFVASR